MLENRLSRLTSGGGVHVSNPDLDLLGAAKNKKLIPVFGTGSDISKKIQGLFIQVCAMITASEVGLALEMRAAIDACAQGVDCGLQAVAEREAAMLHAVAEREAALLRLLAERETAMLHAVAGREATPLWLLADREAAMLRVVQDEREAALQALADREVETNAGREALVADRAAPDSEIGAMEAAVWRRKSRVLLSVGGRAL